MNNSAAIYIAVGAFAQKLFDMADNPEIQMFDVESEVVKVYKQEAVKNTYKPPASSIEFDTIRLKACANGNDYWWKMGYSERLNILALTQIVMR